jgi:type II secretory pathway predicted ATPase ExeA
MYKEFYGLTERPFSKTPDPRFMYLSQQHKEALSRLVYAVEERDLILLTGEIGCGKTTLSRALIDELDDSYKVILLINPRLSPMEFLRSLAVRLDIDEPARFKAELLEQIANALYALYEQGRCPVLIVDEAQLVPHKETFDEIRLLTNFQLDDQNLISVILMGQPELRKRLSHRAYEALRQRFGLQYDLKPLPREELAEYLDFRLEVASGTKNLFQADAIDVIYDYSGGIPRKINHAATLALLEGYGWDKNSIDAVVMNAVMAELNMN